MVAQANTFHGAISLHSELGHEKISKVLAKTQTAL